MSDSTRVEGKSSGNTTLRLVAPRKSQPFKLTVKHAGKAVTDAPYVLSFGSERITGKTSGTGLIEVDIPEHVTTAQLTIDTPRAHRRFELQLGALKPSSTSEGLRQRLSNLGFAASTDADDPKQHALAMAAHCYACAQDPGANPNPRDAAFRAKVAETYGS